MEASDNKKSPETIPDGVREGSEPKRNKEKSKGSLTTDLQGNGYPVKKQSK